MVALGYRLPLMGTLIIMVAVAVVAGGRRRILL